MLLKLKDKQNNVVIKDMLDIDFDMSVEGEGEEYFVNVNKRWRLMDSFRTKDEAIKYMILVADNRNQLENELRNF